MPYIKKLSLLPAREHPYPYDVPAVRYAKQLDFSNPVTFIIGDNGTGKSTLLETIAYRLQLPHIDGSNYGKASFEAARKLIGDLELTWGIERAVGFFFRAEDFGDLVNSVERSGARIYNQLQDLKGEIPDAILEEMVTNANEQLRHVRKNYGQDLQSFSHGEAFLKIMQEKIQGRGIYLLDEPEAALSPARQLALIHFIREHLKRETSQFIIATHAPMLMAFPNATIYEVTADGMESKAFEETEHYTITRGFLNDPELYLGMLDEEG